MVCLVSSVVLDASCDDYEIFISGSTAEFYIKPMMPCFSDIDLMKVLNKALAIPYGQTLPVELLNCHADMVTVFEIINSHQPGYVYLITEDDSYALGKFKDSKKSGFFLSRNIEDMVEIVHTHVQRFCNEQFCNNRLMQSLLTPTVNFRGPALNCCQNGKLTTFYKPTSYILNMDYVLSVFCPFWPSLAADWPVRNRVYGWPDQTIVDVVVRNACHVVNAAHPSCKQDEFMSKHQWRLSFSRAEVTLLNSWTPVQQIVYHMLRFVLKRELFPQTNENNPNLPKLSNYHIKTLMLWECEKKPQSWWSADTSLVKLCSQLLLKLSDCVADKRCEHYFIKSCNLFDYFADGSYQMICNILISIADVPVLLSWFIENYIRKCAESCPPSVSVLFDDISSSEKLERAANYLTDWKLSTHGCELCTEHYDSEKLILLTRLLLNRRAVVIQTEMFLRSLQNLDAQLRDYYTAVTSLQVAHTASVHSLTEDLLEVLWTLFNPCSSATCDTDTGGVKAVRLKSVRKAIKLAKCSSVRSNALEMLHNEMAKAYLHQMLARGHELTYSFVHVLLATLYYKSGHYLTAIVHCQQVVNQCNCDHSDLSNIGADHLPQIDESAEWVFGLIHLYQHVRRKALNQEIQLQQESKPAFTVDLLSHYLCSKCTVNGEHAGDMMKYRQCLSSNKLPLLGDVLLFKTTEKQQNKSSEVPVAADESNDTGNQDSFSMDTSMLVTSLELVALEKLIAHRQQMVRELHSQQFPATNEFEVLYAYRCGLFEECLKTCRAHVNIVLRTSCFRNQLYHMIVLPEFLSLLDGELLSLFGIVSLQYPSLLMFSIQFREHESILLLTLLLYLMSQCQKKLRCGSLYDTLKLIRYVHDEVYPSDEKERYLDRLILKLTYRSLKLHIDKSTMWLLLTSCLHIT